MDGHVDTYIQEQYYLLSIISLFPSVLQSYKVPKALVVPPTQPNMLLYKQLKYFYKKQYNPSYPMEEKQPGFICFSIWHFLLPFAIYITSSLRLPYPPPPFFPSRFVNWICTCSIPPLPTLSFLIHPPLSLPHSSLPPFALVDFLLQHMYFPFLLLLLYIFFISSILINSRKTIPPK